MRHLRKNKKFHRKQEDRVKLFRDLSSALVKSGQIVTFTARAKWFRSKFERLITLAKRSGDNTQLAFRRLRPYLSEEDSRKLIFEIAPNYKNRAGGYTAVYKLQAEFSSHDKSVVVLVDGSSTLKTSIKKSETTVEEVKNVEKKTEDKAGTKTGESAKDLSAKKPAAKKTPKSTETKEESKK